MKDHKLAAIVFTDIVGYTKSMDADEEGTMKLLARQRELIFPLVKEFGGEVIKEIGDGLLMMFTSANRAVRFSMAAQEKLKDEDLIIRAGIHIGDVIFEEGDVFGSAVNIAARIEPLAPAGGICISKDVRSQIRNQGDILTVSIGHKELKGVDQAIEIFQVVSEIPDSAQKKIPFFKDLWQRRVFQITGIYLLMSYLFKLGVGFMVKEYMLSPHLTNLIWYILLSLIPSIILISYFHGRKGVSKWKKIELIGMSLNIVVAIMVLVLVFQGKDLGAITTKLTIENEEGVKVEKLVVKNEFRKKILIYNVENISGDTAFDYLQYGIPSMTEYDLSQDILLSPEFIMDVPGLYMRLIENGYEDAVGLPITLMKQYAEDRNMNYFMYGDLNKIDNDYLLNVKLFDAKITRLIAEFSVTNTSPINLVDELTIEIKKAIGLTDLRVHETTDLPVSEIFTDSEKALYYYSRSIKERSANNWGVNARLLGKACEEDPGFARAYLIATLSFLNLGDMESARNALQSGMDLMYKLPERHQFVLKYVNYVLTQQPEKALAMVKMWVEFYPDDLQGHATLAQRYAVKNMIPEAVHEFNEMLRLDPEQYQVLNTLGDYYLEMGMLDSALVYYQKYAQLVPQKADAYSDLGDYFTVAGDLKSAQENYEKALLLADINDQIPIRVDLANILLKSGEFDLAYREYQDALTSCRSARDSTSVLISLETYYLTKGQAKKSLETYEQTLSVLSSILPPKDHMVYQILNIDSYLDAGEMDRAFEVLDEIKGKLEPPLDNLVPFGYMTLYAELGDTIKVNEAFSGAQDLIDGFGEEVLMANIYFAQGRLNELLGKYLDGIEYYNSYLKMRPTSFFVHVNIARCYRLLKDYDKAEEEILISLKYRPFDPLRNYEASLLYLEMGDDEKGREHLERAVDIWKDADPDYEKANIAKNKLEEYQEGI